MSKKVELLIEQKHPKGDIPKGAIYKLNEETKFYEYKQNGVVVATVNEAGITFFPWMFKIIYE